MTDSQALTLTVIRVDKYGELLSRVQGCKIERAKILNELRKRQVEWAAEIEPANLIEGVSGVVGNLPQPAIVNNGFVDAVDDSRRHYLPERLCRE